MDRTIRFAAGEWRDGDKVNKDKIAAAVSGVLSKTLIAKAAGAAWNANTGKLKLTFKRPSQIYPPLALTESVEVTALVSPDKPGASDRLILWIEPGRSRPRMRHGPEAEPVRGSTGDEEGGEPKDDNGRSTRSPRNSRASAGTPTRVCGSDPHAGTLAHDPEKWAPVVPRDKRETRLRGDHAQIKEIA